MLHTQVFGSEQRLCKGVSMISNKISTGIGNRCSWDTLYWNWKHIFYKPACLILELGKQALPEFHLKQQQNKNNQGKHEVSAIPLK